MPSDCFLTLQAPSSGKYTEKRSKFLSFAVPIRDEENAKAKIKAYQKEYYDARHVCFAYVLGFDGEVTRANDAGEPSGTAGKPILGQIRSANLTFCLVVVVRYYGGTPLGAANLGRAYQTAAAEALTIAQKKECFVTTDLRVAVPYNIVDITLKAISAAGAEITDRQYDATEVQLTINIRLSRVEALKQKLNTIYTLRFLDDESVEG